MPADKGRSAVVLDKAEYTRKVGEMLSDDRTYLKLKKDPTARYKSKLVDMLAKLRKEEKISESQNRYLYPTSETIPRLYCTPKIHKPGNPFRPIVDYTGSIGYNLSRSTADLLAPITGKTIHYVENSKALVTELKEVQLTDEETFVSFDVVSLFTNTPIDKALEVIRSRLEGDSHLKERTMLAVDDIMQLLEFVLSTTYFKFDGQLYQQKFRTAMGNPVSPIVANLYMEHLEQTAIASAPTQFKPRFWKRYVDDVLSVIPIGTAQALNDHLNTIDETGNIKFTNEAMKDNSIPFLDTTKKPRESQEKSRGMVVVPYIKGMAERLARILKSNNISTVFRPHKTTRNIPVHPKDKISRDDTTGCVYRIDCANCDSAYIGETARKLTYNRCHLALQGSQLPSHPGLHIR
ncbi:uncharacterized protein LOC135491023 [Lineus longissimus]|uniref:uncharacterized protein LOC135491023 n=1 Tax=Lineus longissimus TaxID=88925 RepID=UPI002B4EEA2A